MVRHRTSWKEQRQVGFGLTIGCASVRFKGDGCDSVAAMLEQPFAGRLSMLSAQSPPLSPPTVVEQLCRRTKTSDDGDVLTVFSPTARAEAEQDSQKATTLLSMVDPSDALTPRVICAGPPTSPSGGTLLQMDDVNAGLRALHLPRPRAVIPDPSAAVTRRR